MALILVFNSDLYTLVNNKKRIEDVQMKYMLIMQKYLRYDKEYKLPSKSVPGF